MTKRPKHILFLFVDGIGIGPNSEKTNPFASSWPGLEALNSGESWTEDSVTLKGIDANLDLDGLPQSGTGQASLFTGINCAELAGRHFGPYPHSKTKETLARKNIFQQLIDRGLDKEELAFANAYPDRFFSFVEKTKRWTVTTYCCKEADIRLRTIDDIFKEDAVTADLSGKGWSRIGHELPLISPREAGRRLIDISHDHRFTLFEYYLTDKAGHSLDMNRARQTMSDLDELVTGILSEFNTDTDVLILTSDHGNIEDMSSKTHTRNPVPLVIYPDEENYSMSASSVTDVVELILGLV